MMEDCATSMSAPHGCNDDKVVIESFKEALTGRVGAERFRMWFTHGVTITVDAAVDPDVTMDTNAAANAAEDSADDQVNQGSRHERQITLSIRGQFALDRLRQNFLREMRGAAMQACGDRTEIVLRLDEPTATQANLPLTDEEAAKENTGSGAAASALEDVNQTPQVTASQPSIQQSAPANHRQTNASSRKRNRTLQAKSTNGRTQSISSYIGEGSGAATGGDGSGAATGGDGTRRRSDNQSLRIDQAEQLEFPGLNHGNRGRQATGSPANTSPDSPTRPSSKTTKKTSAKQAPQQGGNTDDAKQRATVSNFIAGSSNQLAYTALTMVCQDPKTASPIFFCGPTGTGKTHLMSAIADQLRRRHRMRRVMHLSAEQFTNDFISSVGNSGITAFRRRYREVDALLIDDVQFLGAKKATLREMLYTVETLASAGRPLLFSGLQAPSEIAGLSHELAGRMASGLVCPIQPLDIDVRREILERWIAERCPLEVPSVLLDQINPMLAGDGRVVSGVANMINTLQRMFGRVPSLDEIRQFGGSLLRASTPIATLSVIETAVCDAFHLPHNTLRGRSQTRAVTGPRMLAMYLARQLTASAYAEIATHFGGKSHSTAISAENNVKKWLECGKSIGRGQLAMSTREAVARVENLLRSG